MVLILNALSIGKNKASFPCEMNVAKAESIVKRLDNRSKNVCITAQQIVKITIKWHFGRENTHV